MSLCSAPSSEPGAVMFARLSGKRLAFLFLTTAVAVVLRFAHMRDFIRLPIFAFPAGADSVGYWREIFGLLGGDSLPALSHSPLYTGFMAAVFCLPDGDFCTVRLIQMILGLLSAIPFYVILRSHFRDTAGLRRFVPDVFYVLYLCYPPLIAGQMELFSENLMIPLLSTAMLLVHYADLTDGTALRRRWFLAAGAGLFLGAAVLANPAAAFAAFGSVLYLLMVRKRTAAWFCGLAALCVILPVSLYLAYHAGQTVCLQENSAFLIYVGNCPEADGTCWLPPGTAADALRAEAEAAGETADQYFLKQAIGFIKERPLQVLALCAKKAVLTFSADELTSWSDLAPLRMTAFHRYGFALFPLLAIPGLAAVFLWSAQHSFRSKFVLFFLLFFAFLGVQILSVAGGRFRMPLLIPIAAFSAYFLCSIPRLFEDRTKLLPALAALLVAGTVVFAPVYEPDEALERKVAQATLAEAYLRSGNSDAADDLLMEIRDTPHTPSVLLLLGELRCRQKRFFEAEVFFREAHCRFPDSPLPPIELAAICAASGRTDEALTLYEYAFPRASDDKVRASVLYQQGLLRLGRGQMPRAEAAFRRALSLVPDLPGPCRELGVLALRRNDFEAAEEYFRTVRRLTPHDDANNLDFLLVLLSRGKHGEADPLLAEMERNGRIEPARSAELRKRFPSPKVTEPAE